MSVSVVKADGKTGIARLFCSLAGKNGCGKGYADLFNHNWGIYLMFVSFQRKKINIKREPRNLVTLKPEHSISIRAHARGRGRTHTRDRDPHSRHKEGCRVLGYKQL